MRKILILTALVLLVCAHRAPAQIFPIYSPYSAGQDIGPNDWWYWTNSPTGVRSYFSSGSSGPWIAICDAGSTSGQPNGGCSPYQQELATTSMGPILLRVKGVDTDWNLGAEMCQANATLCGPYWSGIPGEPGSGYGSVSAYAAYDPGAGASSGLRPSANAALVYSALTPCPVYNDGNISYPGYPYLNCQGLNLDNTGIINGVAESITTYDTGIVGQFVQVSVYEAYPWTEVLHIAAVLVNYTYTENTLTDTTYKKAPVVLTTHFHATNAGNVYEVEGTADAPASLSPGDGGTPLYTVGGFEGGTTCEAVMGTYLPDESLYINTGDPAYPEAANVGYFQNENLSVVPALLKNPEINSNNAWIWMEGGCLISGILAQYQSPVDSVSAIAEGSAMLQMLHSKHAGVELADELQKADPHIVAVGYTAPDLNRPDQLATYVEYSCDDKHETCATAHEMMRHIDARRVVRPLVVRMKRLHPGHLVPIGDPNYYTAAFLR